MEIVRSATDGVLIMAVDGRLDGYWADHLDTAIGDVIRDGHHHLRLNLSAVTFLSSAGIAVLVKYRKQLAAIGGTFQVIEPSAPVRTVLQVTKLLAVLTGGDAPAAPSASQPAEAAVIERDGVRFEVFTADPAPPATVTVIGHGGDPLTSGLESCTSLGGRTPLFALGVGAFGSGFADCRLRFGELLSVAGVTAYQPADGTNVADYLSSTGPLAADVQLWHGLTCDGRFPRLARFEAVTAGSTVGLSSLLDGCLSIAEAGTIGVVGLAESAGLVGAALRRSPARPGAPADLFAFPDVRTHLSFTAERAFPRSLTLFAGIVARDGGGLPATGDGPGGSLGRRLRPQLRPLGPGGCYGHLHAAAFPFRPLRRGRVDLAHAVHDLFETQPLLGVLHLLADDRGPGGAGQSEFIRGACWIGAIADGSGAGA
jgi:anti-anti-sigma factor